MFSWHEVCSATLKFNEQFLLTRPDKLNFLLLWRLNLKNFESTEQGDKLYDSKKSNRKLVSWTSAAIALVLSACGSVTRSTSEVPLADETSNTPTAFDDKLIGSDDLDTFTALAGDDEIYGFGGNDQIIAGTGNDTIYGGDGDDNIQPGAGDDTTYGEGGNDTIAYQLVPISRTVEMANTIIFGQIKQLFRSQ